MGDQALYLLTSIRTRANYAYILLFDQILITPTLQYNFSVKITLTKYLIPLNVTQLYSRHQIVNSPNLAIAKYLSSGLHCTIWTPMFRWSLRVSQHSLHPQFIQSITTMQNALFQPHWLSLLTETLWYINF